MSKPSPKKRPSRGVPPARRKREPCVTAFDRVLPGMPPALRLGPC